MAVSSPSSPLPFAWSLNPLSGLDKIFAPVREFVASHMEFLKKGAAVVVMWHVATTVVKLAEPYIAQHNAAKENERRLKKEKQEAGATLKAKYGAVAASMTFVATVYQQYEQLRGEYPWNAVYRSEVWPAALGGEGPKQQKASAAMTEASARSYLELAGHLNTLNGFWDEVVDMLDKKLLEPKEFTEGWYRRWANYRHLCEPLFIATFYRSKFDHKLRKRHDEWAYTNPAGKKRPSRYTCFEKREEFRPKDLKDDPLQDTLVWAREFESQLKAGKDRDTIDLSKLDPLGALVTKSK